MISRVIINNKDPFETKVEEIMSNNIICISLIPADKGYLIRLYNSGGTPEPLSLIFKDNPREIWFTDFDGNRLETYENETVIPAYGIRTVRVIKQ